jgi:hypothetical protein
MTMRYRTFDEINDATGFAGGVQFNTEAEVRAYFTQKNMEFMFGADLGCDPLPEGCVMNDAVLRKMAERVIANRWHCAF